MLKLSYYAPLKSNPPVMAKGCLTGATVHLYDQQGAQMRFFCCVIRMSPANLRLL